MEQIFHLSNKNYPSNIFYIEHSNLTSSKVTQIYSMAQDEKPKAFQNAYKIPCFTRTCKFQLLLPHVKQ